MDKKFFKIADAAEQVGICAMTIRRLIKAGKVKAKRRGFGKTSQVVLSETEISKLKRTYCAVETI